jgi:hypothetical protein
MFRPGVAASLLGIGEAQTWKPTGIAEEVTTRAPGSPSRCSGRGKAMAERVRWLVTECMEGCAL